MNELLTQLLPLLIPLLSVIILAGRNAQAGRAVDIEARAAAVEEDRLDLETRRLLYKITEDLRLEVADLRQQLAQHVEALKVKGREVDNLRTQLREAQAQIGHVPTMEHQIEELQAEVAQLKIQVGDMDEERKRLQQERDEAIAREQDITRRLNEALERIRYLSVENETLNKVIARLKAGKETDGGDKSVQ